MNLENPLRLPKPLSSLLPFNEVLRERLRLLDELRMEIVDVLGDQSKAFPLLSESLLDFQNGVVPLVGLALLDLPVDGVVPLPELLGVLFEEPERENLLRVRRPRVVFPVYASLSSERWQPTRGAQSSP